MAFPTGWQKKHDIEINLSALSLGGSISNYPYLITEDAILSSAFSNSDNGGGDIRFSSDAGGSTQLPCEVIEWDTSGETAIVWVRIPTLSTTTTTIYIWYDNTGESQPAAGDAYGSQNVWSEGFEAVWHFHNNVNDSTSNGYDLTNSGATLTTTNAKIGYAADFENTQNDYMTIADASCPNLEIASDQTWQAWVRFETNNADQRLWTKGWPKRAAYLGNASGNWTVIWYPGATPSGADYVYDSSFSASANTWYLFHGVYDDTNTTLKVIRNGTNITTDTGSGNLPDTNSDVLLGRRPGSTSDDFDGMFDEFRVSSVARSNDWCEVDYATMNSPATYVTAGTEATSRRIFTTRINYK